ncbi:MAG: TetR/AcrR family transcriptional regulator [Robiginitomaculum sp.]|nr:TetR/AcrR family transcriptional regulator [Robiginitomaculum sp.]
MPEPDKSNDKKSNIIDAAFSCFTSYGFKRTNMADIAKAAGMSRPALYLLFENKRDIGRAMVRKLKDASLYEAKTALQTEQPIAERLATAFHARETAFLEIIEDSAHGRELFDTGMELAEDIIQDGKAEFSKVLQRSLRMAVRDGQINLTASGLSVPRLAEILIHGAHGQKTDASNAKILRRRIDDFLVLVMAGLLT